MTGLAAHLDDYLALRRSLGYQLAGVDGLLGDFVSYLEANGEGHVRAEAALAWASGRTGASAAVVADRLSVVRRFARYLRSFDERTEVPPKHLVAAPYPRRVPYLYSNAEVRALMRAALGLEPAHFAASVETLIGLMAATGLRPGEGRTLQLADLDLDVGELLVRDTKFAKSRVLPLGESTVAALAGFVDRRMAWCPETTTSLFVSARKERLGASVLSAAFTRLRRVAGIDAGPGRRPPRLYDLRHAFAVATLLDWHAAGEDVEARLPVLSAYLGHANPSSTYWYLEASPELLAVVARRLEAHLGSPR